MNSQEAQEILKWFRPGTADAADADFAGALEFAKGDPELSRWFESHCAAYQKIRGHFKRIEVPAGLKEQILAERPRETSILSPRRPKRSTLISAVVASIILPIAIAVIWLPFRSKNDYPRYRNRMVSTALRVYSMDLKTNDADKIRSFLKEKTGNGDYAIPAGLNKLEFTGCVVLRWQNKPVSMICLRTERLLAPGESSDVFLFITEGGSFPKEASANSPAVTQVNKLATASWVDGGKNYLLAAQGDEELIRKILSKN